MPKPIKINIASPCRENWEEMTTSAKGRFCNACQKEVIDFTRLTDAEASKIIKANPGGCGIFLNSQLNRDLNPPHENKKWLAAAALAAGILSFATPAAAQSTKETVEQGVKTNIDTGSTNTLVSNEPFTLTGTVKDGFGEPLKHITIQSSTGKTAKTNRKGKFSIDVRPGEVLSFYYKGNAWRTYNVVGNEGNTDIAITISFRTMGRYF